MTLPEPLHQLDRTWVQWRGQTLAFFGGCDYFRLSSHPKVIAAAHEALDKYGLNVSASRWTTGNHDLYNQLEFALANFFQSESSLIIANGYLTNTAVLDGLEGAISHIFIDEKSHGSLFDAVRGRVEVVQFKHRDPADLAAKISSARAPLIITDGVFSHDGGLAPLPEYLKLLPPVGYLLVDDSHGGGVLGQNGRGTHEYFGIHSKQLIQTVTLSKAIGCFGGVILTTKNLCEQIAKKSPAIPGATPFPLPLAAAALVTIEMLKENQRRAQLAENFSRIAENRPFPIHSVFPKSEAERDRLTSALLARGIFPSHIRYGKGFPEGYFRFAISSEHTRAQLDALAAALKDAV